MKRCRRVMIPILLLIGMAGAAAFGAQPAPAIPEPGRAPEYAVPSAEVQSVALTRATSVWPRAQAGPAIPYQDFDGNTVAWMFHYRVDGRAFPASYGQAAQEAREDIARFPDEGRAPPTGRYRYAHVLVSARYDRTPVIAWGEGLSEYYSTASEAADAVTSELGGVRPELKRIYLYWPLTWFEFEGNGRSVVVHSHLLAQREPAAGFIARQQADDAAEQERLEARLAARGMTLDQYRAVLRLRAQQEWKRAHEPAGTDGQAYVYNYQFAPFYDWSFGCTPTSTAMIYGWLDKEYSFGRLVDWHTQRYDPPEQDIDYSLPNVQRELGWAMASDSMGGGATPWGNIVPGLTGVAANSGYSITAATFEDYNGDNDWCWADANAAINAGQTFLYSINRPDLAHTVAVFGYDNVLLAYWAHNTWDPPGEWWSYNGLGGDQTYTRLDVIQAYGPTSPNLSLYEPKGDQRYNQTGQGEVWHAWERRSVSWYAETQDSARTYLSYDGGRTWSYLSSETFYSSHGVDVVPGMVTDSARARVELFCQGPTGGVSMSGATGSIGNFRIVNVAPPVPEIIYPPNGYMLHGRSESSAVAPTFSVHSISYADSYEFGVFNDSAGWFASGWIADTSFRPLVPFPVGSTGFWHCQAKNPTGLSGLTINATYQVVPGYTYPKHKPRMKKKTVKHGGAVAHRKKPRRSGMLEQEDENIFFMNGNNTLDFQVYSVWNDTWAYACSIPAGPRRKRVKKGGYLVADTAFAYALKGGGTNEFYRYNPPANAWDSIAFPSFYKGVKGGFAVLADIGTNSYIYAGSGSSNNEWLRYNIGSGSWEAPTPAALPVEKAKIGSSFACDTSGHLYFLLGGGRYENELYSLDLNNPGQGWQRRTSLPLIAVDHRKKVKEGGCIEYYRGMFYAVKGGRTRELWSYDPNLDAWAYLCEIGDGAPMAPARGIACGRSLTAAEFGIYILFGNNTDEFYFFAPPLDSESGSSGKGMQGAEQPKPVKTSLTAFPNPFTSASTISYTLPEPGNVGLRLYDVTGKLVTTLVQGYQAAGRQSVTLSSARSGPDISSGIYLLRLDTDGHTATAKLIIE